MSWFEKTSMQTQSDIYVQLVSKAAAELPCGLPSDRRGFIEGLTQTVLEFGGPVNPAVSYVLSYFGLSLREIIKEQICCAICAIDTIEKGAVN